MTNIPDPFTRRKGNVIHAWRSETHREAALYILTHGGSASNTELAQHLKIPPKGLRSTMQASGLFVIEIRQMPGRDQYGHSRDQVWYRVRDDLVMPPRVNLPALIRVVEARKRITAEQAGELAPQSK